MSVESRFSKFKKLWISWRRISITRAGIPYSKVGRRRPTQSYRIVASQVSATTTCLHMPLKSNKDKSKSKRKFSRRSSKLPMASIHLSMAWARHQPGRIHQVCWLHNKCQLQPTIVYRWSRAALRYKEQWLWSTKVKSPRVSRQTTVASPTSLSKCPDSNPT